MSAHKSSTLMSVYAPPPFTGDSPRGWDGHREAQP
jgi:hypothetical protein